MLCALVSDSSVWLESHVRLHFSRTPGNFRAGLMVFDGSDVDEVSQNTTFVFRENNDVVGRELKKLLCFLFRQDINNKWHDRIHGEKEKKKESVHEIL